MIVNTAYMYMGKKGPSVNPKIWEGGTVNYPYRLYGSSSFQAAYSRFSIPAEDRMTFTLPLKNFTKITFGTLSTGIGRPAVSEIKLIKNGAASSSVIFKPTTAPGSVVVNIPAEFQDDDVIVEITAGNSIYLTSGVMS